MADRIDQILEVVLRRLWHEPVTIKKLKDGDEEQNELLDFILTRAEMVAACDAMVDQLLSHAQRLRKCSKTYDLAGIGAMSLYYESLARKIRDIGVTLDIVEDANKRASSSTIVSRKSTEPT